MIEGHNLFAPNRINLPHYEKTLPAEALRFFIDEFNKANPTAHECNEASKMPWGGEAPCFDSLKIVNFPDQKRH